MPQRNPLLNVICRTGTLAFERSADKIAVTPDQSTAVRRAEVVERNAKLGRQDIQTIQTKSGAVICHVADTAGVNAVLA